jgi:steroid 5-alpha reductase family enzyme
MNFALVAGASVLTVIVVHGATFFIARQVGRYNVVDIAWGIGFVAVAAMAAVLGSGDLFRRVLLLALTAVWGLRLAGFLFIKTRGKGEDRRYRDLLKDFSAGNVIRKVFVVQAEATWFVSLPE